MSETDSGVVFFVGGRAYKLNKPLDLGFLDFGTRERRETRVCGLRAFDRKPRHLRELPPKESARKHVEFMGGADSIMPKARAALEAGETRWAAQVLDHVVFADPGTRGSRPPRPSPRPPRPSPRPARAGQRRRHLAQLQPAGRGGTAREEAHEYLRHPYRAPERSRPRLRHRHP
ncbi:alkyl sulfatase dimerization domain-containing protein [Spirillospora sp. NPDC000708]